MKGVEEFYGLVDDVAGQKGVLVCPQGFTEAAKRRASDFLIDLYSPVDTGLHKWKASPYIPALCDFRDAGIGFRLRCSAPYPFRTAMDFFDTLVAHDTQGKALGTPLATAMDLWNNGNFPSDPGEHRYLPIYPTAEVLVDNGYGRQIPVTLTANLVVRQKLFFGLLPITDISGFKDEIGGGIITNAFTVGMLDPEVVTKKSKFIAAEADAPIRPTMKLVGRWGWHNG